MSKSFQTIGCISMISHFTQLSILIFGGFLSFETTVRRDKGTMMLSVVVPAAAGKTASVRHAAATNRQRISTAAPEAILEGEPFQSTAP